MGCGLHVGDVELAVEEDGTTGLSLLTWASDLVCYLSGLYSEVVTTLQPSVALPNCGWSAFSQDIRKLVAVRMDMPTLSCCDSAACCAAMPLRVRYFLRASVGCAYSVQGAAKYDGIMSHNFANFAR